MKARKGFTLIELLIVIAIIAILAIIVVLNLANARDKANFARAKADIKSVSDAIRLAQSNGTGANVTVGTAAAPINFSSTTATAADGYIKALKDDDGAVILGTPPTAPAGFSYNLYTVLTGTNLTTFGINSVRTSDSKTCSYLNGNVVNDANCKP